VRTEPIQPDPSKVLIAWFDEQMRQGSGTHMDWHWDFDVFVEAWNGEALRFVDGHVLRYADEQCMAAVRLEYHENFKAMFNRWPR
jgi:hypothetical protein